MDWETLRGQCQNCRNCPLCSNRTHVVFGAGAQDAEVLFVGEAPGEAEDRLGEPFVGAAGKLLDEMLELIDLDRRKVYIANTVKCRPPYNRDPLPEEQKACSGYLQQQIALLRPQIIVCLGRIAAKHLIHPDFRITREHGRWSIRADGTMIMALYHPSALLRDVNKRPDTFVDLKTLQQAIRQYCSHTY